MSKKTNQLTFMHYTESTTGHFSNVGVACGVLEIRINGKVDCRIPNKEEPVGITKHVINLHNLMVSDDELEYYKTGNADKHGITADEAYLKLNDVRWLIFKLISTVPRRHTTQELDSVQTMCFNVLPLETKPHY